MLRGSKLLLQCAKDAKAGRDALGNGRNRSERTAWYLATGLSKFARTLDLERHVLENVNSVMKSNGDDEVEVTDITSLTSVPRTLYLMQEKGKPSPKFRAGFDKRVWIVEMEGNAFRGSPPRWKGDGATSTAGSTDKYNHIKLYNETKTVNLDRLTESTVDWLMSKHLKVRRFSKWGRLFGGWG